jgi:hypothetical protein
MVADQSNGRTGAGKFAPGNKLATGNPHAKAVQRLRAELMRTVTAEDLRLIVAKLVEKAKAGDVIAAREVLDRCLGKKYDLESVEELPPLEMVQVPQNGRAVAKVPQYVPSGPF